MPPKKNKGQKLTLTDFFAETTGGSWADEMENLPSAPAPREDTGPRRGEPGYLDSMPDRAARSSFPGAPQREEVPIPTVPPFTAFVGNLTFETEEDQLRDFFADLDPTSVRLVKDADGKAKGFGYVEFTTQQGLRDALARTGVNLAGRSVRVNVAEAPASGPRRDFGPSAADEASQWRRSGPLPTREAPAQRRQFSGASEGMGQDRDWGAARGAKFTPSRESSGYGHAREPREEMHQHSVADDVNQWRSSNPLVEASAGAARAGGREAPPHRPTGPADTESTWSRGTRVAAPPAPAAEVTRKRLNLAPRTGGASETPSPDATTPPASKASPFGAARPVDTLTRELEAEQRAEQRRKEAAAAREAAKAKEEKARAAREEAQKQERERRPAKVHPSRMPAKEKKEEVAAADEEGFEAVRGKAAVPAEEAQAVAAKPAKPAPKAKAGFSFAAAAGALGDEVAGDDDVEEVTEGVKDVAV